jgi:hypothetical protein
MNKVFIPQEPTRRDPATGELVSIMNFALASKFGETVVCLPPGRVALSTQPVVTRLREHMGQFSDDDFLIAVGDPSVLAMAAAIAASVNRGRFKMLKYDAKTKEYCSIQVDIHYRPGQLEIQAAREARSERNETSIPSVFSEAQSLKTPRNVL